MAEIANRTPMDRFVDFMTADIDGDREIADRVAREMMRLKELPPHFLEMRQRLRQCRTVEEMHRVHQSYS